MPTVDEKVDMGKGENRVVGDSNGRPKPSQPAQAGAGRPGDDAKAKIKYSGIGKLNASTRDFERKLHLETEVTGRIRRTTNNNLAVPPPPERAAQMRRETAGEDDGSEISSGESQASEELEEKPAAAPEQGISSAPETKQPVAAPAMIPPAPAENPPVPGETAPDNAADGESSSGDSGEEEGPPLRHPDDPFLQPLPDSDEKLGKMKALAAKQELVGKASSKIWHYGLTTAVLSGVTLVGFLIGLGIMDFYWLVLYRRNKEIFPLKTWQKAVTAGLNAALVFVIILIIVFFVALFKYMCDNPTTYAGMYITGTSGICTALESAGMSTYPNQLSVPGRSGSGTCATLNSGAASVANLSLTCFGSNAPAASSIAGAESGGDPTTESKTDVCHGDGRVFSVGLFQINLLVHTIKDPSTGQTLNCPSAFTKRDPSYVIRDASGKFLYYDCSVKNLSLYTQCVAAAKNANSNIEQACVISKNGTNWSQWSTHTQCGL